MPARIRPHITSKEIERWTSDADPGTFVSLCNAYVWDHWKKEALGTPQINGQINTKDGGVDAEAHLSLPSLPKSACSSIVGRGWNVYQYKFRDLAQSNRSSIINNLVRDMKGALDYVRRSHKKTPSRYVLFTNLDVDASTRKRLRKSISDGWKGRIPPIEFIGASHFSAFFNSNPLYAFSFKASNEFRTWEEVFSNHIAQTDNILIPYEKYGAANEALTEALKSPLVRIIGVVGLPGVGKTRALLDATRNASIDTIFFYGKNVDLLLKLLSSKNSGRLRIVVIEDYDHAFHGRILSEILGKTSAKVIVNSISAAAILAPVPPEDPRYTCVHIKPLGDDATENLIRSLTKPRLDFGLESWIVEVCGGLPNFIIKSCQEPKKLRGVYYRLIEWIGTLLKRQVLDLYGKEGVDSLRIFSALSSFKVVDPDPNEVDLLLQYFGRPEAKASIMRLKDQLEKDGWFEYGRGLWTLRCKALSIFLAGELMSGQRGNIERFLRDPRVTPDILSKFLVRLADLQCKDVREFWESQFDEGNQSGWFRSLKSAMENFHLLKVAVDAIPDHVGWLLKGSLEQMDTKTLQGFYEAWKDEFRDGNFFDRLLVRRESAENALRALGLLAQFDATKDHGMNNAFYRAANLRHPQMDLSLDVRLQVFRDFTSSKSTSGLKLLAISAIHECFAYQCAVVVERSDCGGIIDSNPGFTYSAQDSYFTGLVGIVKDLMKSADTSVSQAAACALPDILTNFAKAYPDTDRFYDEFEGLVKGMLSGSVKIPVDKMVSAIDFLIRSYKEDRASEEVKKARSKIVPKYEKLLEMIHTGPWRLRLRLAAGPWIRGDYDADSDNRFVQLAKELVEDASLLTPDLFQWLCSLEAQKSRRFFLELGKADKALVWRDKFIQLGKQESAADPFAGYFGGVTSWNAEFVDDLLDEFVKDPEYPGSTVLFATHFQGGSGRRVKRIGDMMAAAKVTVELVTHWFTGGGWSKNLSADEFVELLQIVAQEGYRTPVEALDFMSLWVHAKRDIPLPMQKIVWDLIEHLPGKKVTRNQEYSCDQVAKSLVDLDWDRALAVFKRFILEQTDDSWDVLERHSPSAFFSKLYQTRRKELIFTMLDCARDRKKSFRISMQLKERISPLADKTFLEEYASVGEPFACAALSVLTSAQPGFWPFALSVLEKYPESSKIREALHLGVHRFYTVIGDRYSVGYKESVKDIEAILSSNHISQTARDWLQDAKKSLSRSAESWHGVETGQKPAITTRQPRLE